MNGLNDGLNTSKVGQGSGEVRPETTQSNKTRELLLATPVERSNSFAGNMTPVSAEPLSKISANLETLQKLIESDIATIDKYRTIKVRRILENDPYFVRARELCTKYELGDEAFHKFRQRVRGFLCLPCILLPNANNGNLDLNAMVEERSILAWIENILKKFGFGIGDIVILDRLPMLTDKWLSEHPAKREEAIKDMSKLACDFLNGFKPSFTLVCQCCQHHYRWLGSWMNRASLRHASTDPNRPFTCNLSTFPPARHIPLTRSEDPEDRKRGTEEEASLGRIFETLFKPYTGPFRTWSQDYWNFPESDQTYQLKYADFIKGRLEDPPMEYK
ncbi:hypothetical protein N7541_001151 [Penicillium brevicompactum]|uniref:Uncharacterized protein n=1 Tax=Penicillium brevicompactum TaxID=5074 RepID=A0A9W9V5I3_PENBR|nr:hypothetical protein N7541_001151 [Penicillium brevicompactum]